MKMKPSRIHDALGYAPHAFQAPVMRSDARFRVVSAGRRFGKSQIGGYDLVSEAIYAERLAQSLMENRQRREFWIVGPNYCVDDETEILTQRGWLRYDEVVVGDQTLGQNSETGLAEWTPVEKVNILPAKRRMLVHSVFRGHDSMTTENHRWLVQWGKPGMDYSNNTGRGRPGRGGGERSGWRFVETGDLYKANERIHCAAPVTNLPDTPKYSDEFVELLAWYYTEGNRWGSGLTISQNAGPNLLRIQSACQRLLGNPVDSMRNGSVIDTVPKWRHVTKQSHDLQQAVALNGAASSEILEVCPGKGKIPTADFIASLTRSQLELFVEVSMLADADSDWDSSKSGGFGQNCEARCDAFQMAAQLAGYRTTKVTTTNDYGPWWVVTLWKKSKGQVFSGWNFAANSEGVLYDREVWCPTTGTGTWLARRNGRVFFTGNSDAEKEFRILWNALTALEVPFDKPGSYNHPEGGMMSIKLWNNTFQVHAKSAQHPESLVGEGLRGAVLAEAAKLKPSVWFKYIRPTLADFNGWALMASTPEGKNWFYESWQRGQDAKQSEWESWRLPSWLNPHVYRKPTKGAHVRDLQRLAASGGGSFWELREQYGLDVDDEVISLLNDLVPEAFNQEIAADFTEFVGRVFKEFDEELHVTNLEYNPSYRHFAAMDAGYTNPSVWLFIQVDPWGNVQILDEIYETGLTADEFAGMIVNRHLHNVECFYPDPASPGDNALVERIIRVPSAGDTGGELKDRLDAIRRALRVPSGLAHLPWGHPERTPKLQIDRRCKMLIHEMNEYRYPEKRETILGDEAHEKPMKKDDHTPEALGRFFAGHNYLMSGETRVSEVEYQ